MTAAAANMMGQASTSIVAANTMSITCLHGKYQCRYGSKAGFGVALTLTLAGSTFLGARVWGMESTGISDQSNEASQRTSAFNQEQVRSTQESANRAFWSSGRKSRMNSLHGSVSSGSLSRAIGRPI